MRGAWRSHVAAAGAAVLLFALAVSAPARAGQQPADIVVMTNGDRLTGEIKSLSQGKLSFDEDATGIVSIKWDRVAEVTSRRLFEVETSAGDRLLGTLGPAGPARVVVEGETGRFELDLLSVVGLAPISNSFVRRLDGSISVGGSYTQSSGVAQLSAAFSITARWPAFEWRASVEDYITLKEADDTSERFSADVGYSRYLWPNWAVLGWAQVERNPDLGFEVRSTVGGGFERTLLRTNRSSAVVGVGLAGAREHPVDGEADTLLPAALFFRHSFFTYSTPKTSLDTKVAAFPILNQWGRWLLEADTSVSREIFKNFSVALTFYESFDNRPPTVEADQNDLGTTLSVAFTF
ncbi:MAG: hypothetical protein H6Q10_1184 [Acidobacteria bacterium]|nr:hypothetical protein [Acidobacteriota bacterium]